MKKLLSFLLMMNLIACNNSENNSGGMDSSGGDTRKTSIDNTRHSVEKSWEKLGYYLQSQSLLIADIEKNELPLDSFQRTIKGLLSYFHKPPLEELKEIKLNPIDGDCFENLEAKDASYSANTICVSVSRLSKLPLDVQEREITALLLHELSHHFGYVEILAEMLQESFIQRFAYKSDSTDILLSTVTTIASLNFYLLDLEKLRLHEAVQEEDLCKTASDAKRRLQGIMDFRWINSRKIFGYPFTPPSFVKAVENLNVIELPCAANEINSFDRENFSTLLRKFAEATFDYQVISREDSEWPGHAGTHLKANGFGEGLHRLIKTVSPEEYAALPYADKPQCKVLEQSGNKWLEDTEVAKTMAAQLKIKQNSWVEKLASVELDLTTGFLAHLIDGEGMFGFWGTLLGYTNSSLNLKVDVTVKVYKGLVDGDFTIMKIICK